MRCISSLVFLLSLFFPWAEDSGPLVISFRGTRSIMPDNSQAGFKYAMTIGADALWVEVQTTKDGILVIHDQPTIDNEKCLNPDGTPISLSSRPIIRNLTLDQVKAFDCGSLGHPLFPDRSLVPGALILTLSELIDLLNSPVAPSKRDCLLIIELKYDSTHKEQYLSPGELAWSTYETVVKGKILPRVEVASSNLEILSAFRLLDQRLSLIAVMETPRPSIRTLLRAFEPDVIAPRLDFLTPEDIELCHSSGARLYPWLANSLESWRKLAGLKIDGILTDTPEELIHFLENAQIRPDRFFKSSP